MASLPAFHSFQQADAAEKYASAIYKDHYDSDVNTSPRVNHKAKINFSNISDPTRNGDLGDSEAQSYQKPVTQVKATVKNTRDRLDDDRIKISSVQPPQMAEIPVNNIAVDGDGHKPGTSPSDGPDSSSAGASLYIKTDSDICDPKDPTFTQALHHPFDVKSELQNARTLQSNSGPAPELPEVSINITASIIFITMRVGNFLLSSAMPPAVVAFFLNMLFVYPQDRGVSGLTAFSLSAMAVLAWTLFILASSIHTIIQDNKTNFKNKTLPDFSGLAAASYLFVLGSGGHTTEMVALVKLSQRPYHHTHRRYLITAGDNHSRNQAKILEDKMTQSHPDGSAGTSDIVTVTRARSVHQSYITSVFTSLKCFFEIVNALSSIPLARIGQPGEKSFQCPHVIVTNGPGTGFIVGLVAFFLKVFHVVPRDRLKVVFVETWARTHSLGLTGKLFYLTQIADLFVVQSEQLAKAISKPCIGNVNKKWADLINAAFEDGHDMEQGAE